MSTNKNIPERMCVCCRNLKPKNQLIRIVKTKEGRLELDASGKKPGRGFYLCYSDNCKDEVFKSKKLNKIFKMNVPDEVYETLKQELKYLDGE